MLALTVWFLRCRSKVGLIPVKALSKLLSFAVERSIGDRIVRMRVTAYPSYAVTTSVLLVNVSVWDKVPVVRVDGGGLKPAAVSLLCVFLGVVECRHGVTSVE